MFTALQNHDLVTNKVRHQLFDVLQTDNCGATDTHEFARFKLVGQRCQGFTHDERIFASLDYEVVACGFDGFNFGGPENNNPVPFPDRQMSQVAFLSGGCCRDIVPCFVEHEWFVSSHNSLTPCLRPDHVKER